MTKMYIVFLTVEEGYDHPLMTFEMSFLFFEILFEALPSFPFFFFGGGDMNSPVVKKKLPTLNFSFKTL